MAAVDHPKPAVEGEPSPKRVKTGTELPVWDMAEYLADPASNKEICQAMADCLHKTGILVIRDPRVSEETNNQFLDMMERYFDQPNEEKKKDERPDIGYQLGVTPEGVEFCRCGQEPDCVESLKAMPEENRPHIPEKPDPKWRFFWRMGEWPSSTRFPALNSPPVIPAAFPEWEETMNNWGSLLLQAVTSVAEMVAVGLDLEPDTFTSKMQAGPHLLAPTGSDLSKFNEVDTIFAGYHYDLNFLTIHGKSRYPGLFVWLRDGTKVLVRVPDGCLLVQAAKQIEYVTGGHILAGNHEVVVVPETLEALERAKAADRCLWRVSSTLFSHLRSDEKLAPIPPFDTEENKEAFPEMYVGEYVQSELEFIKLAHRKEDHDAAVAATAAAAAGAE